MDPDLVSCDIVVVMAETCAKLNKEIGEDKFVEVYRLCHRTLEIINLKHPMAGQCAMALQTIRQHALKTRQGMLDHIQWP